MRSRGRGSSSSLGLLSRVLAFVCWWYAPSLFNFTFLAFALCIASHLFFSFLTPLIICSSKPPQRPAPSRTGECCITLKEHAAAPDHPTTTSSYAHLLFSYLLYSHFTFIESYIFTIPFAVGSFNSTLSSLPTPLPIPLTSYPRLRACHCHRYCYRPFPVVFH